MINKLSLFLKLLLVMGTVTVLSLAVGVIIITARGGEATERLTLRESEQLGHRYAEVVRGQLNDAIDVGRFLAVSIAGFKKAGMTDRAVLNAWLESVASANPALFGVWVGMEPNALDGRDKEFVNTPGTDKTGRFLTYWNRGTGKVAVEPIQLYDDQGPDGQYYQVPKRTGREYVTEPTVYQAGGRDVLMVSLCVPILIDGRFAGVAGVDLSNESISKELGAVRPLETGAVHLISNDGNWASFAKADQLGKPIDKTAPGLLAAKAAIKAGNPFDQNGGASADPAIPTRQLFLPIQVGATGMPWSLLVELPLDRIAIPRIELRNFIVAAGGGMLIALLLALWITAREVIARPLRQVVVTIGALTGGDASVEVPDRDRGDEIGAVNKALQLFKENSARITAMEERRREDERTAAERRRAELNALADRFERTIGEVVTGVSKNATLMRGDADGLAAIAEETNRQASVVAAAAEEASTNVHTVAAASEELAHSISEINERIATSSRMATDAVGEVERTNETVEGLAAAAQKIGDVVSLIQSIASQTNLLALNATIEAARAGEAGKGFAVVAQEVKNLASQTAKATEDISGQINDIQNVSGNVVAAIRAIGQSINQISETVTAIAAAAEEQGAATREISRNVQHAANGTREVSDNIVGVSSAAGETGALSGRVLNAAHELSDQSDRLGTQVSAFLQTVRAG